MKMIKTREVIIIVDVIDSFSRSVIRGACKSISDMSDVHLSICHISAEDHLLDQVTRSSPDGIILCTKYGHDNGALHELAIPVIDICSIVRPNSFPRIGMHFKQIGAEAASQFIDRKMKSYAYYGPENQYDSDLIFKGFAAQLNELDIAVDEYRYGAGTHCNAELQTALTEFIKQSKKPIGLLAYSDIVAQDLLTLGRNLGVTMPDEIAVIGIGNDELICHITHPTLSSVITDSSRIGEEAMAMILDMQDGTFSTEDSDVNLLIPPLGVFERRSTEVSPVIDDRYVSKALKIIRDRACEGIKMDDVTKEINVSRSYLERNFRKHIGHSPQTEMRLAQIAAIKRMLSTTDKSLTEIAYDAGFNHTEYMSVVFKRITGTTPGKFRQQLKMNVVSENATQ